MVSVSQNILVYRLHPSYGEVKWYDAHVTRGSEENDVGIVT